MSSVVNPPHTIDEEHEEENPEENDDFGSEEESQNETHSGSENSEVDQENELENQEEEETLVRRESGEQVESNSEQEEEEEEEEEEENSYDNQEEIVEKEEIPPIVQVPRRQQAQNRSIPRSMYYSNARGQQRQRRRWVSPQRPNPRIPEQRMRDYKENFMADPLSLRIHHTQMDNIKEELSNVIQETIAKSDYINELEQKLKIMEIDNTQLQRINMITEKKLESFQKNLNESNRQCDLLTDELNSTKSEIEKLKKSVKDETAASNNLEKRLSQANTEIEKSKTELAKHRELSKEHENNYLKKIEEMLKEKKNMEKQNAEMHKVIKKHMSLIANLRRQVMHIEAAAALKISEEQFIRAIEKHY